ncbi:hypothetical protein [Agrilactobacillus fermenti]|nr:hypothetical protein [Agrilactobacillus fermenti]
MKYKIMLNTETQLFTVVDAHNKMGQGITIQAAIKALKHNPQVAA